MTRIVETFSPQELARVVGGELVHTGRERLGPVSTDTRSVRAGDTFFALVGERFDAHDFLQKAVLAEAGCLVVERAVGEVAPGCAVVRVDNTTWALGELARAVLERRRAMGDGFDVVGVTGSNGKTTTKEMLRAVLSERGPILATKGNFNNDIGLPLTVFELEERHERAVLEMGMNAPGEIERLCEIARPEVRVLTSVAEAHLEGLGSVAGVARAKGEMFASGAGARWVTTRAVLDAHYSMWADDGRWVLVGAGEAVEMLGWSGSDLGMRVRYRTRDLGELEVELPVLGAHNALNFGLVLAVLEERGGSVDEVVAGARRLAVPSGRLTAVRQPGGWLLLNDAYNANPSSMRAAFETVAGLVGAEKRLLVLGEMRELGEAEEALHAEVGAAAAAVGCRWLVCLGGALGRAMARGAREAGLPAERIVALDADGYEEAARVLRERCGEGDVVLLKGSRGARLERVLEVE